MSLIEKPEDMPTCKLNSCDSDPEASTHPWHEQHSLLSSVSVTNMPNLLLPFAMDPRECLCQICKFAGWGKDLRMNDFSRSQMHSAANPSQHVAAPDSICKDLMEELIAETTGCMHTQSLGEKDRQRPLGTSMNEDPIAL